ncbi:MAG: NAD(P)-dependent oxidoreductase [Candidatus Omnitrophica bacterium]|nr:NAD(P)-dependent oxidoreductase [Candidatus Omnitrophota bacterium]MDD5489007.1 NAD(P)-dependent oxidoreductase [Candidatus Omnitrophota bacterium]
MPGKKTALKIMVTGGSGFLGSHIADALTAAGHEVYIFDIKPSKFISEGQHMLIGDIMDGDSLKESMKGMDVVYHLAAMADVDAAQGKPYETMRINVLGTTNVLEAAVSAGVGRLVFASTIYVYSRTGSFYRVSKHACELLLEAYHEKFGLEHTVLRFGTLYGPRADKTNSVHRYLTEAFKTGKIEFKGTGKEVREYIHVKDAAEICVNVLDGSFSGETLILTGHHRMRLNELLDMINEILGGKIHINYSPKDSRSHYEQTPYSYIPRVGKKLITNKYCDLGQSLVEILDEINISRDNEEIRF